MPSRKGEAEDTELAGWQAAPFDRSNRLPCSRRAQGGIRSGSRLKRLQKEGADFPSGPLRRSCITTGGDLLRGFVATPTSAGMAALTCTPGIELSRYLVVRMRYSHPTISHRIDLRRHVEFHRCRASSADWCARDRRSGRSCVHMRKHGVPSAPESRYATAQRNRPRGLPSARSPLRARNDRGSKAIRRWRRTVVGRVLRPPAASSIGRRDQARSDKDDHQLSLHDGRCSEISLVNPLASQPAANGLDESIDSRLEFHRRKRSSFKHRAGYAVARAGRRCREQAIPFRSPLGEDGDIRPDVDRRSHQTLRQGRSGRAALCAPIEALPGAGLKRGDSRTRRRLNDGGDQVIPVVSEIRSLFMRRANLKRPARQRLGRADHPRQPSIRSASGTLRTECRHPILPGSSGRSVLGAQESMP